MTDPQDRSGLSIEISGEVVDEGTTRELVQDKLSTEDILRENTEANQRNVNDEPGFQDGRLGGSDGEDRQGEPNQTGGDSDLEGDARGGDGTERSGGIDGGPARKRPLPGQN